MTITDSFLLVVRWLHLASAAAWVGGSLFYLVVLRPAMRRADSDSSSFLSLNLSTAREFRALVDTSIFVLLATGIILTFNRLTPDVVGMPYVAILATKIALSFWMFVLARGRRNRARFPETYDQNIKTSTWHQVLRAVSGYNTIVILGMIVFLLSDLLKILFEIAIRS